MTTKIEFESPGEEIGKKKSQINAEALGGKVTEIVGTGENAKNSFSWTTITWSFIIGGGISFLLYIRSFFYGDPQAPTLISDLKTIWSIFVPLITLALGYSFGKGTDSK